MENKQFNVSSNNMNHSYECSSCKKEYTLEEFKASYGFCPICSSLLIRIEALLTPPNDVDCGLGIFVLDFNESMNEISYVIERYLPRLKNVMKDMYLALIGFAKNAELLGIIRCSEIKETEFWKKWIVDKHEEILKSGNGTNISAALKLARKVYDAALNGQMDEFGLKDFALLYQNFLIDNQIVKIANLRVFLFTDGGNNVPDEPFLNHFKGASVIPGKNNISGLVIFYFIHPNSEKYRRLEEISGVCPIHNEKGIIHISSIKYIDNLVLLPSFNLIPGFCCECYKTLIEFPKKDF